MFAYCGNNPVNRVDTDGQSWEDIKSWIINAQEKLEETVEKVVKLFDFIFDAVDYRTHKESIPVYDYGVFGFETGTSSSVMAGDSNSPVAFFREKISTPYGHTSIWHGIAVYIGDGGIKVSGGDVAVSMGVAFNNGLLVEWSNSIMRSSFTIAQDANFRTHSVGVYSEFYIRPAIIGGVAVLAYFAGAYSLPIVGRLLMGG